MRNYNIDVGSQAVDLWEALIKPYLCVYSGLWQPGISSRVAW